MTTTTIPAPRRITTLQYVKAAVAVAFGWEPEHPGADDTWDPLADLGTGRHHANNITAAAPHYLLSPAAYQRITGTHEHVPAGPDDHTGVLNLTHIHDALAGATR